MEGVNGTAGKILDWTRWVAQVLVLPTLVVFATAWWSHEERIDDLDTAIQVMEGNRFTSADGLLLQKEIALIRAELKQQEIDGLRRELERLRKEREGGKQ